MDVSEIRKLEDYMKKLFVNSRLRVTPRSATDDLAEVHVGQERLGVITVVDDDDDERSYNFEMTIPGNQGEITEIGKLDAYFKRKFDNERIRVVARPKKNDLVEVYIGDEFIGVLFADEKGGMRTYHFDMAILGEDLG